MANFEVIDSTGNFAKVRYKGIGTIGYRNLNKGTTAKQQSFAASKQNQKFETVITERDENGNIVSSETKEKDEGDGFVPPPSPVYYRTVIHKGFTTDDVSPFDRNMELKVWLVTDEPHNPDRVEDELESGGLSVEGVVGAGEFDNSFTVAKETNEPIDKDEFDEDLELNEINSMVYYKDQEYQYTPDRVQTQDREIQTDLGEWERIGGEPDA